MNTQIFIWREERKNSDGETSRKGNGKLRTRCCVNFGIFKREYHGDTLFFKKGEWVSHGKKNLTRW